MKTPPLPPTSAQAISRRLLLALFALATSGLGMAPGPALSQETAQTLLARSDAVRNPAFSYSTRVVLSEYKAGREQDTMVLRSYARPAQRKGEYQTLVSFLRPSRDLGKHMLKNGNDLWFYDPAGNASIRLSPQQRLLGQAANADVVITNAELVDNLKHLSCPVVVVNNYIDNAEITAALTQAKILPAGEPS